MDILIIMCVGIVFGRIFVSVKFKKTAEHLQIVVVMTMIFMLGVGLGDRDGFLSELTTLGLNSFIYFLIPTAISVFATYFITKKLFGGKGQS